jgi:hypothetical protein
MAKQRLPGCAPTTHALIIKNAAGQHINGTSSRGDIDYACQFARSILRLYHEAASIDIYRYDPNIHWRELQPITTVTLDDEAEK